MALSDKAKAARDKLSTFGQWMDDKAVSQGTSLQEIAQYIGQDYAFVSRLSAGTKSPTYDMARQIGEMVDDAIGALIAAGFDPPSEKAKSSPSLDNGDRYRRTLASGDEIRINPKDTDPDDTARRTEAFLIALRKDREK